jgi:hypothetical protein
MGDLTLHLFLLGLFRFIQASLGFSIELWCKHVSRRFHTINRLNIMVARRAVKSINSVLQLVWISKVSYLFRWCKHHLLCCIAVTLSKPKLLQLSLVSFLVKHLLKHSKFFIIKRHFVQHVRMLADNRDLSLLSMLVLAILRWVHID